MENIPQQAPIPLEQAIIPFHGNQVLAMRLPDDRVAATLSSLCAMLGIRPESQARRVRRSKGLSEQLVLTIVETAGGPQRMDVLIAEAIPSWVLGVQVEHLAPEKRPLILALKVEVVHVLYRYFFGPDAGQATQPIPEAPHAAAPVLPEGDTVDAAPDAPWDRLLGAMDTMQAGLHTTQEGLSDAREALRDMREEGRAREARQARQQRALTGRVEAMEEWLTSLDRRVAASGQGGAAGPGWAPALSAAHLADLRALVRLLAQTSGISQALLEQELSDALGVAVLNAIPDDLWPNVLTWLWWRAQEAASPRFSQ